MKRSNGFLLCAFLLLLGGVIGFLLAPAKKGVTIGSNNKIYNYRGDAECGGYDDDEEFQDIDL